MKGVIALLSLEYVTAVYAASDSVRPRGVSPEFAKYYKDQEKFTCISHPSIGIPNARVNDDYCDCPDGSDEPGTSACAHLSPLSPRTPADKIPNSVNSTPALPGFYCKNKGHIPSYVPFTSVNDGVCDYDLCCDGSEEWEGVGGVKCQNKCAEIGKEWRKQDEARQKSLATAAKKRKELIAEAEKLRKQVEDRIQTLTTQVQGSEVTLNQMEQELVDTERREKGKIVRGAVNPKAGKLGVLVGLGKQRTEELRVGLAKVRLERNLARDRIRELEQILTTFKEEYNPNFNDEGVKRAVRAWDEYAARDKGAETDASAEADLDNILLEDKDNGLDWDQYQGEGESDTDVLYAFENYLPPSIRTWLDQKLRDFKVMLVENGILADSGSDSGESKAVTDARARRDTARTSLETQHNDLRMQKEDLERDFGPEGIFRALRGQCISKDSGEYTYELCFMDRTMQIPKKGGGSVNMGNFVRLETITVDEVLPPNGKGLGSGERTVMKHENGQHCWNGPSRSTMVILACSEENEVWKIVEEEKCVYRMEVGTPAACEPRRAKPVHAPAGKDEL